MSFCFLNLFQRIIVYRKEANRIPLLTHQEEIEIAKQLDPIDLTARNRLVRANTRLVIDIAGRYQGRGVELLDLIQSGNIGLIKAAEKFDISKGYRFSTYATWWIRDGITKSIATESRTIRLPVHVNLKISKLKQIGRELAQELNRAPTHHEIADKLKIDIVEVKELLHLLKPIFPLDTNIEDRHLCQFDPISIEQESITAQGERT